MRKTMSGFTIVELLIVIIVIAILAAITLVVYNGVQSRAYDSVINNDMSTLRKKFALFRGENDRYPSTVAELDGLGLRVSLSSYAVSPTVTRNYIYCFNTGFTDYTFLFKSKSGNAFSVTGSTGAIDTFTTAWTSSTTAGSLCDSIDGVGGVYNTTNQSAGYWTGQTPNWTSWTGQ